MEKSPDSKLIRIFVGETDKVDHEPLYEQVVYEAKKQNMAGATVLKGVMSFGATSRVHKSKVLALSDDMPMVVEIVDEEEKINIFLDTLKTLFEKAGCGGLVTMEKMDVIYYRPQKNK
jgi:PII-like signaling protein